MSRNTNGWQSLVTGLSKISCERPILNTTQIDSVLDMSLNFMTIPIHFRYFSCMDKLEFDHFQLHFGFLQTIYEPWFNHHCSTTHPMGASLSDVLFSFRLEKYIACDVCRLRSASFESSNVLSSKYSGGSGAISMGSSST